MPRSANSNSAADKIASRVPVDLSGRAIRSVVIASVNTARHIKSSHLFDTRNVSVGVASLVQSHDAARPIPDAPRVTNRDFAFRVAQRVVFYRGHLRRRSGSRLEKRWRLLAKISAGIRRISKS
jgi:hypothetical protein